MAGEGVSVGNPLGIGGERLIWYGDDENDPDADFEGTYGGVDASVLRASMEREGAVVMGRRTYDVSVEAWGENPPIAACPGGFPPLPRRAAVQHSLCPGCPASS